MKKVFLLAGILSVTAFGAIVENINSLQATFYYAVNAGKVSIKQCEASPASDLEPGRCQAVSSKYFSFEPIELKEFEAKARAWAQSDLAAIASSIEDTRKQLAQKRKLLAEIDEIIKGLPQGSPALPDYQDRRKDVSGQIARLESAISTGESQLGGFDLLFGQNGYLAQDLLHPIAAGQSTYLAVRPFVAHFFDVFKYREQDPSQSLTDARAEFARFRAEGRRPYCAYWSAGLGAGSEIDSSSEGIIRTLVSLDRSESFPTARASCQALGMDLPVAGHIPGYHSHLWAGGSEEETWPVEKSTRLFAETDLAKGLSSFDYLGRSLKIFWVQINWYSRAHRPGDIDAFFISPEGDWFRFNDGEEGVGVKSTPLPVDPSWNLSVVCEKQYPTLPRYIRRGELPECLEYSGWP